MKGLKERKIKSGTLFGEKRRRSRSHHRELVRQAKRANQKERILWVRKNLFGVFFWSLFHPRVKSRR